MQPSSEHSRILFLTTYEVGHEGLGGGGWVDRRLLSGLVKDIQGANDPAVEEFAVASHTDADGYPPLEVRGSFSKSLRTLARMLIRREPYQSAKFRHSSGWALRVKALQERAANAEVIVVSQLPGMILAHDAGLTVDCYVAHNVDSVLAARHQPRIFRVLGDQRHLETLERKLLDEARSVFALSASDVRRINNWGVAAQHLKLPIRQSESRNCQANNNSIGLLGKMSWPPNLTAAQTLVREIMPLVALELKEHTPSVALAGLGADELASQLGVDSLGYLDNVTEFYSEVSLVVVPRLGENTGISVKMLEALEHGCDVVVSNDLAVDAGVENLVTTAKTNAEFACQITEIIRSRTTASNPTSSTRRYQECQYNILTEEVRNLLRRPNRYIRIDLCQSPIDDLLGRTERIIASRADFFSAATQGDQVRIQTVNLHHLALAKSNMKFRDALTSASYVTADGWPIALALRRSGFKTDRVTGSDFVQDLVDMPSNLLNIGILGASTTVGSAFEEITVGNSSVVFREHGHRDKWDLSKIVQDLNGASVNLLLVAVTPPHGDIIAHELHLRGFYGTIVGVGGAIDMVTGHRRPAPRLVKRMGSEWVYRLVQEPTRLARRYLVDCLPLLVTDLAKVYWRSDGRNKATPQLDRVTEASTK